MTPADLPTNPAFEAALDEKPSDHATRLVYSDWLEEVETMEARTYAAGLRWEMLHGKRPRLSRVFEEWVWYGEWTLRDAPEDLPNEVFQHLKNCSDGSGIVYKLYHSRTLAEKALAITLASVAKVVNVWIC